MNSTIDVALRLRLQYQGRDADKAERDLKDLNEASQRLGRTKGGDALARDLRAIGRSADEARQKLGTVGQGLSNLKGNAREAVTAIGTIKTEANETRQALGRMDDGAFAGLKRDAYAAKLAITEIGQAAERAEQKMRGWRGPSVGRTGGLGYNMMPGRTGSGFLNAAEGAVDQFGLPIALGAGGTYLMGALPAGAGVLAGAAVNAAAGDEQRSDHLRVTGEYDAAMQARIDELLKKAGARRGVGTSGAQGVFSALQAGGLSSEDAAAMTDNAIVFSGASQADPTDAANLTIALRNNMGIKADGMMAAYDAIALGGKRGQFEVPDMARNFPELAALMQGMGEKGQSGVNLLTALLQAARSDTGTSGAAATNVSNMLGKFMSSDFERNASKLGLNPEDIIKKAQKGGEQPVLAMLDAIYGKVGTDPFRLKQLMPDIQAGAGLVSAVSRRDEIRKLMEEMDQSGGSVERDYAVATDNLNSQKDRLFSNIAANVKDMAGPLLPALTAAARMFSENIEAAREAETKDPQARVPGAGLATEGLKLYLKTTQSNGDEPSMLQRFLFGKAAEKDFNLREHMGVDLRSSAQSSMEGYNDALASEGAKAQGIASSIAESIKALFGFTVSPTIQPTYVPPSGGGATTTGQQHTSVSPTSNRFNQTIISPNSMHAGRQSRREIQKAQARTLYDTGRRLA